MGRACHHAKSYPGGHCHNRVPLAGCPTISKKPSFRTNPAPWRDEIRNPEFAGIDNRYYVDPVVGYKFLTGPKHFLKAEAGADYVKEEYVDDDIQFIERETVLILKDETDVGS